MPELPEHALHEVQYIGCEECVAEYVAAHQPAPTPLTGIQKADLEQRRKRITIEDGPFAYFSAIEQSVKGDVS